MLPPEKINTKGALFVIMLVFEKVSGKNPSRKKAPREESGVGSGLG